MGKFDLIKSNKGSGLSKKTDFLRKNNENMKTALGKTILPRLFHQLVVFVIDASHSMTWDSKNGIPKAQEVDDVIKKVIERLKRSRNKESFDVAMFVFSDESKMVFDVTTLDQVENKSFNPIDYIDEARATYLSSTMSQVLLMAENYLDKNKNKQAQVLVQLLTDGQMHDYDVTAEITNQLKSNDKVKISTMLLETEEVLEREIFEVSEDVHKEYLSKIRNGLTCIASESKGDEFSFTVSTLDPEEIRKHMIQSISTVSKID